MQVDHWRWESAVWYSWNLAHLHLYTKTGFFFNFFAESAGFAPRNNCVLAYITYLSVIADLVVIMINAEVAHG